MKRFGQVLKLRPEYRDDYVRHHDGVVFAYFATQEWWANMPEVFHGD